MQQIVYLFILDGMADWEVGYAVAGMNQPAFQQHPGRYAVRTVAESKEPVVSMGGVRMLPDAALSAIEPAGSALLILPGAPSWDEGANEAAVALARRFLAAGVPVAAICGATAGLARAGLLNDRPHTSNAAEYLAGLKGYSGAALYRDEPCVVDSDLITASGTAPLEFARAIFARLEVYAPSVLDAWYALYAKGDASGFHALQAAAQ